MQLENQQQQQQQVVVVDSNPNPNPNPGAVIKRYAPPNQRNRSSNRRKSSSSSSFSSELGVGVGDNIHYPTPTARFVALQGCSGSAASHLLTHRWTAAMHSFNNPKDSSEKPVMYSGGTSSVWTQFRLPHQIMTPPASASSSVPQLDFLGELRRQMHSADTSFTT
ncbi:hypothetical protein RIF29_18570 [Crotalaria pallida]|uniref:Uncharacterized protein n=1 Tax=Crotalaria pallida TaxID=3830 RepID=A0AAN9IE10_CROPI